MTVREDHLNFLSVGHGGMVFSLADVAFSAWLRMLPATAPSPSTPIWY